MSIRCKVCNTSKITNEKHAKSNEEWECQICGNSLDTDGNVITLEKY